jgi:hypothetical protein
LPELGFVAIFAKRKRVHCGGFLSRKSRRKTGDFAERTQKYFVFGGDTSRFGVAVNNCSHRNTLILSGAGKLFTDYSQTAYRQ